MNQIKVARLKINSKKGRANGHNNRALEVFAGSKEALAGSIYFCVGFYGWNFSSGRRLRRGAFYLYAFLGTS